MGEYRPDSYSFLTIVLVEAFCTRIRFQIGHFSKTAFPTLVSLVALLCHTKIKSAVSCVCLSSRLIKGKLPHELKNITTHFKSRN